MRASSNPLFRGLLSILMLVMGMEATARIGELRKVGQWYAIYAFVAPLLHGFIAFGLRHDCPRRHGIQPWRRRDSGRHRRLQFRHLRAAHLTSWYPVGQSLCLHRRVHSRRHACCPCLGNTALHRARPGWVRKDTRSVKFTVMAPAGSANNSGMARNCGLRRWLRPTSPTGSSNICSSTISRTSR
jgi:hypothetical protein